MKEGTFKTVFVVWTFIVLMLMASTIFVAVHFLSKYW